MAKDPAFLFYSKEYIQGTAPMTLEEKGAYVELLAHQHQSGFIPKDEKRIARILGVGQDDLSRIWPEIKEKFVENEHGLVNEKLLAVINQRKKFLTSQAEKAKKGAKARWGKNNKKNMPGGIPGALPKQCSSNANKANANAITIVNENKGKKESEEKGEMETLVDEALSTLLEFAGKPLFRIDAEGNRKAVRPRIKDHGIDMVKKVFILKAREWKGSAKMERFIHPKTICQESKFEKYMDWVLAIEADPSLAKSFIKKSRRDELIEYLSR